MLLAHNWPVLTVAVARAEQGIRLAWLCPRWGLVSVTAAAQARPLPEPQRCVQCAPLALLQSAVLPSLRPCWPETAPPARTDKGYRWQLMTCSSHHLRLHKCNETIAGLTLQAEWFEAVEFACQEAATWTLRPAECDMPL